VDKNVPKILVSGLKYAKNGEEYCKLPVGGLYKLQFYKRHQPNLDSMVETPTRNAQRGNLS